jgi:hypothetical protein
MQTAFGMTQSSTKNTHLKLKKDNTSRVQSTFSYLRIIILNNNYWSLCFLICTTDSQSQRKVMMKPPKECKAPAPVAHACNPSYSGGSDQEDEVF